ncbi:MAG TPA: hypothetical protein VND90_03850 [Terracidiphilus sp.]|nr:hypothetical protein [Terracidiphilus sp.]
MDGRLGATIKRAWATALPAALAVALLAALLSGPMTARAQDAAADQNAAKARAVLNEMVQALGGEKWLNLKNEMFRGHIAAFFHGQPDLGTTQVWQFHQWPDHDRIEVTKHRDVVDFFIGNEGWEVTYRGKAPLPKDIVDEFLRRRAHSIETAVKVWMKDPKTILIFEGQHMANRHMGDQVTLIAADNQAITILADTQTHLPIESSFQWRDPVYHDKNTETEDYTDYHVVDGLPAPFTISRTKNGEMTREFFVTEVQFNRTLPAEFWDVNATARRIKKK